MKSNLKKIVSILLCFTVLMTLGFSNVFAATNKSDLKSQIKVVQNDKNAVQLKVDYKGQTLYGTFDKKTKEVEMHVDEAEFDVLGISVGNKTVAKYEVKIENGRGGDIDQLQASIIDTNTKKEYKVGKYDTKVIAQLPLAWAIITVFGEAVLADLLAYGAAIVVGGVTLVLATVAAENLDEWYDYFYAYLDSGNLYIGGGLSKSNAKSVVKLNKVTVGVMCRYEPVASNLAYDLAVSSNGYTTWHDAHGDEGYYKHYHVSTYSNSHVWYGI